MYLFDYATAAGLQFRVFRPAGVTYDKRGEPVEVQVINLDGEVSNISQLFLQTYRMVVFGDSIAWGQGLLPGDKYSYLVARHLQRNLGDIGVYNEDLAAHSGAKIGLKPVDAPGLQPLPGEVPTDFPTIAEQVNMFAIREPAAGLGWIDLVLLDGGVNDAGLDNILNPLTSTTQIKAFASTQCYYAMRTLLNTTLGVFPIAKVIVTGYYPFISYDSDTSLLLYSLTGLGVILAGIPGAIVGGGLSIWARNAIATNAETFSREANAQLRLAVEGTRAANPQRSIALAVPPFGSKNAALAPESWVWEIDATMTPQDPVAASRAPQCAAGAAIPAYRVDPARCRIASIGHPNPRGAQAYLDAIVPLL